MNTTPSSVYKPYRGRTIEPVAFEVYRNLTRGGYSIRASSGTYKGLVVAHADEVTINGCFMVNQAGRLFTRRTGKRTVHAWVSGFLVWGSGERAGTLLEPSEVPGWWYEPVQFGAKYNPFRDEWFVDFDTNEPIYGDLYNIHLGPDGVSYGLMNATPQETINWRRTWKGVAW